MPVRITFNGHLESVRAHQMKPVEEIAANDQRFRILVVEDHVDTAFGLKMYFSGLGHDVRVALDVKSALAAAEESPFDMLLSDLLLPDGNGWDLLRQLRSRGPVRAIALSGHNDEEDIARSKDAGFLLHLAKPIAMPELNRVFTEAMKPGSITPAS